MNRNINLVDKQVGEEKPLVGILTLPLSDTIRNKIDKVFQEKNEHIHIRDKLSFYKKGSYVASSYILWLEKQNVDVITLDVNDNIESLVESLDHLDGLVLTGGAAPIYIHNAKIEIDHSYSSILQIKTPSHYTYVVGALIKKAKEINKLRKFPIWATCLGFESTVITELDYNIDLTRVNNDNYNSSIKFIDPINENDVLNNSLVRKIAEDTKSSRFNHIFAFPYDVLAHNTSFNNEWKIEASSITEGGIKIVAYIRSLKYPFFATQFHPEKNGNEHSEKREIPQTEESVILADAFAKKFVSNLESQRNASKQLAFTKKLESEKKIYQIGPIGVFREIIFVSAAAAA